MGLDNGVEIYRPQAKTEIEKFCWNVLDDFNLISGKFKENFTESYLYRSRMEVVYMRKWWGVRDIMVGHLCDKYATEDNYLWELDGEDIDVLIEAMDYYNNKEAWDSDGGSVWDYEEDGIADQIAKHIRNLNTVKELMRDKGYKAVFYDSY